MIEGQRSYVEQQPDVNPLVYKISSIESTLMGLEGNYNKRYQSRIDQLKRDMMELKARLAEEQDEKNNKNIAA